MKQANKKIEAYRLTKGPLASKESSGNDGAFFVKSVKLKATLGVIISDGGGWDHVSVSLPNRCPTWKEMCFIKDLFFEEEECVIQIHPPKSTYVNDHKYCLHLWRNQKQEMELPPLTFV